MQYTGRAGDMALSISPGLWNCWVQEIQLPELRCKDQKFMIPPPEAGNYAVLNWATTATRMPLNIHEDKIGHAAEKTLHVSKSHQTSKKMEPTSFLPLEPLGPLSVEPPSWPPVTPACWCSPSGIISAPLYKGWSV